MTFLLWQRSLVAAISRWNRNATAMDYAHHSTPTEQRFSYVKSGQFVHTHPYPLSNAWPLNISVTAHGFSIADGIELIGDTSNNNNIEKRNQITIRAVYFINTKVNPNYGEWIHHQFTTFGHGPVREIYLVADAISCANETSLHEAFAWLKQTRGKETRIYLDCHDDPVETYEYHGIQRVWELGQRHHGDNDVAVYFHAKGVTHGSTWKNYTNGDHHELSQLTDHVFSQPAMDRVVDAFRLFPSVLMAGEDCALGKTSHIAPMDVNI